jgi:DNA-directed RNA polymerase specialized sigma24 family protein
VARDVTTSSVRRGFHIVDALNDEWDRLAPDRGTAALWAGRYGVLAACVDLDDVLLAINSEPDAALGALLTEVARNDRLAARTVLQAMLGKLVRMACVDDHVRIDDYVAAMWLRICDYPLARRPRRIAANLVLDTLKLVKNEQRLALRLDIRPWPPGRRLDELHESAGRREVADHQAHLAELTADAVLDLAAGIGLVDRKARHLLESVYADGLSGEAAAKRHGTTAGSVRVRCSRAVRHLARHASQLAAAA